MVEGLTSSDGERSCSSIETLDDEVVPTQVVDVIVVEARGPSVVVEWKYRGRVRRTLVPKTEVVDGQVSEEVLKQCPIMSVEWADYFKLSITPKKISDELRRLGVWTVKDFEAKPDRVFRAISRLVVRDLQKMLKEVESGR